MDKKQGLEREAAQAKVKADYSAHANGSTEHKLAEASQLKPDGSFKHKPPPMGGVWMRDAKTGELTPPPDVEKDEHGSFRAKSMTAGTGPKPLPAINVPGDAGAVQPPANPT